MPRLPRQFFFARFMHRLSLCAYAGEYVGRRPLLRVKRTRRKFTRMTAYDALRTFRITDRIAS